MRIGIDLGGTKIEGIVLDRKGHERARLRMASPQGSYSATLDALESLVVQLETLAGISAAARTPIGMGIPGAISTRTGRVKNANSTWLIGEALDRDLAARLGRAVKIENDANCLALSEATDGAAAGADPVFAVILGTGVGGAIVSQGKLIRGAMAIAGEWGHNPLPVSADPAMHTLEWPGPPCYCGRRACIETWLSGPGLAADHMRSLAPEGLDSSIPDGLRQASPPARADASIAPAALVAAAQRGDLKARASLERWFDRLARALAGVINILDPEVIVVAGGLSQVAAIYEEIPRRWGAHVFSDRVDTRILPARHGDASGVRGAAWLWSDQD